MNFAGFLLWLTREGFEDQEVYIAEDQIIYPSRSMIINIHDFLVKFFKDMNDQIQFGTHSEANIDFALLYIQNQVKADDRETSILLKAANLMNIIITSHPFVDGNKRTGFVMALMFLSLNKYPTTPDLQDYDNHVEFFKKIASRNTKDPNNVPEIVQWFRDTTS